jgi:phospholipase/carboxylesterase
MSTPSTWHNENGFEYRLFPAKTGKPDSLVIYMHGHGSDPYISDEFLSSIHKKIPGADVIALQAPLKITKSLIPGVTRGYGWVPLLEASISIQMQVKTWLTHVFNRLTVAEKVEAFARAELTKRGLTEDNLAYIGTSMGAIVALQAGLSGTTSAAAIVSRGGAVLPFTSIKSKPRIFLQIGEVDELFNRPLPPPGKGFLRRAFTQAARKLSLRHDRSVARLKRKRVPLTEKVYPKLGHMLDHTAWNDGVEFIAKSLPPPKP